MLESLQRFFNTYSYYDHLFLKKELGVWYGRVLDVGCGSTRLKRLLPSDCTYAGIDFYGTAADYKTDISKEHYPFENESFDFVICNAVLEHVENPDFVVSEIWRVLKKGGKAYISVPFLQPYHPDPEDYRRLTPGGLIHLLERRGFKLLKQFEIFGTSVVLEYLCFFDLIQFIKSPTRFLNPFRYFQLVYLIIIYLLSRIFNLIFAKSFQADSYASPGVKALIEKI